MDSESTREDVEQMGRVIEEALAFWRQVLRDAEDGTPMPPFLRGLALRELMKFQKSLLDLLPRSIEVMVETAFADLPDEDPVLMEKIRSDARNALIDYGLLKPGELESFPLASLREIALERYRRWEVTGDTRG
jgi:hypothetical protein